MFTELLYAVRGQGVPVSTHEWLAFLGAIEQGLVHDVDGLYRIGRAILCRTEADFDAWDVAFAATFNGAELPEGLKEKLEEWLRREAERPEGAWLDHGKGAEELWEAFKERLAEQGEEHHGGNKWVGTGGKSPFGHSGKGARGVRIGGKGGGRQAMMVAMDRRWQDYRKDRVLDVRNIQVALRALRNLVREGEHELDMDLTIRRTCDNAGDIEIVERRARKNSAHVVLLMDAGGSMAPHFDKVSRLFSAATKLKTFKSFKSYAFHNCVYGWVYNDYESYDRIRTDHVLRDLTPKHRLIFVGDASMAPYELFNPFGWPGTGERMAGIDWLRRFRKRCPASVWINPDPTRYWNHPTVRGIGQLFPMYELTVGGIQQAVKKLRAPI